MNVLRVKKNTQTCNLTVQRYSYVQSLYGSVIVIFVVAIALFKKTTLKRYVCAAIDYSNLTGSMPVIGFTIYI